MVPCLEPVPPWYCSAHADTNASNVQLASCDGETNEVHGLLDYRDHDHNTVDDEIHETWKANTTLYIGPILKCGKNESYLLNDNKTVASNSARKHSKLRRQHTVLSSSRQVWNSSRPVHLFRSIDKRFEWMCLITGFHVVHTCF